MKLTYRGIPYQASQSQSQSHRQAVSLFIYRGVNYIKNYRL
jgi:hypothetical protein